MQSVVCKRIIAFYSLVTRYLCCGLKTYERERERKREGEISNRLNPSSPSFQNPIILHKRVHRKIKI
jgi:hypothetical protein